MKNKNRLYDLFKLDIAIPVGPAVDGLLRDGRSFINARDKSCETLLLSPALIVVSLYFGHSLFFKIPPKKTSAELILLLMKAPQTDNSY